MDEITDVRELVDEWAVARFEVVNAPLKDPDYISKIHRLSNAEDALFQAAYKRSITDGKS